MDTDITIIITIIGSVIAFVVIVLFVIILVVNNRYGSSQIDNNYVAPIPTGTVKTLDNYYTPYVLGDIKYYILCAWYNGNPITNTIIDNVNSNSITSTNNMGSVPFYDSLVTDILGETQSTLGDPGDLHNFVDPGSLCSQNILSQMFMISNDFEKYAKNATFLINPTSTANMYQKGITDTTKPFTFIVSVELLDYLCSVYVNGGVVLPPTFTTVDIFYTDTAPILPTYAPKLVSSKSWSFVKTPIQDSFRPGELYQPIFILLKVTAGSALDVQLEQNNYYINNSSWDKYGQSTIALTKSFFPPFK